MCATMRPLRLAESLPHKARSAGLRTHHGNHRARNHTYFTRLCAKLAVYHARRLLRPEWTEGSEMSLLNSQNGVHRASALNGGATLVGHEAASPVLSARDDLAARAQTVAAI